MREMIRGVVERKVRGFVRERTGLEWGFSQIG
jgi:hypothetical protein